MSNVIPFPTRKRAPVVVDAGAAQKVSQPEPVGFAGAVPAVLPVQPVAIDPMETIVRALMFYAGNGRAIGQGHDDGRRARAALNCLAQAGVIAIQS